MGQFCQPVGCAPITVKDMGLRMIEDIIKDMMSVARYLPFSLLVGIPAGVLLGGVGRKKAGRKKGTDICVLLFFIYFAALIMITFLSRESGSRSGRIDLELFSTWGINARNNAYVVENILLFFPYGILGSLTFPKMRRMGYCVATGAFTSICIESLQLVTGRGYFQIDDILTNTLGMFLGYLVFGIGFGIVKLFRRKDKRA